MLQQQSWGQPLSIHTEPYESTNEKWFVYKPCRRPWGWCRPRSVRRGCRRCARGRRAGCRTPGPSRRRPAGTRPGSDAPGTRTCQRATRVRVRLHVPTPSPLFVPFTKWVKCSPYGAVYTYVKKIKGTAHKNSNFDATCKPGFSAFHVTPQHNTGPQTPLSLPLWWLHIVFTVYSFR